MKCCPTFICLQFRTGLLCMILGVLAGVYSPALASNALSDLHFSKWQTENGLPSNKVLDLLQTRDGFIWIATLDGVARFDGVKFTVFDNTSAEGLGDQSISCMFEGRDGSLWLGHLGGTVTRYKEGRFETKPRPEKQPEGLAKHIATDENGEVWVFSDTGYLTRLRDGYSLRPEQGPARLQTAMTCTLDGRIWVASAGCLSVLEGDRLRVVPLEAGAGGFAQGIGAATDGGLWAVIENRIRKYRDGKWAEDLGAVPFMSSPVHVLKETSRGQLLAGTSEHGFFIIPCKGNAETRHISRASGFVSDWVPALCEDREGGIWVGTGGAGLFMIRSTPVETPIPDDNWKNRAVLTVSPTRRGGLWIGTEGAGLYHFDEGRWENYAVKEGLQNQYVWSVLEDSRGLVLAGTWGNSIYSMDQGSFSQAEGFYQSRLPVFALLEAKDGAVWIGTSMGLLRYRYGKAEWVEPIAETRLRDVRTVLEASDGTVWFGSLSGGLRSLKNGRLQSFGGAQGLTSDFVQCLHLDQAGALWIGTSGRGLFRFKGGRFSSIGIEQGLADSVICHIEEDQNGYLWMSSHAGLLRVRKADLDRCAEGELNSVECLSYGLSDGMPSLKCSGGLQPAGCVMPDGRFAFATSKGLAIIDPTKIEANLLPPPVSIVGLRLDERELKISLHHGTPLLVAPGSHRIEFQFSGLSFAAPEKVRFKRRLVGLEKDWVQGGARRSAEYNYLPPGSYVFQVKACNNDGVWNETGASFSFAVLPYFWQTWWFRLLVAIALLAASGTMIWYETRRRLHLKLAILEQKRAIASERARIASDMHDDLGSHLTCITMLSETARNEIHNTNAARESLTQIYDTARGLTRAMDEIVWAVNPKHDTMDSLVTYLEKFALDFLGAAGIRCRLELPLEYPKWTPSSDVRHNLFLAFKEALNNAAKHAGADTVSVSLEVSATEYRLTVRDDGRGFILSGETGRQASSQDRIATGNGLTNMRQRMERIKGRCQITSAPGQGTTVTLSVPAALPMTP